MSRIYNSELSLFVGKSLSYFGSMKKVEPEKYQTIFSMHPDQKESIRLYCQYVQAIFKRVELVMYAYEDRFKEFGDIMRRYHISKNKYNGNMYRHYEHIIFKHRDNDFEIISTSLALQKKLNNILKAFKYKPVNIEDFIKGNPNENFKN